MPTNFDPNNYAEFYQEALKKWEDMARSIASQTTELAKWSAMEQVRDQWFALWQASKYWDTQNYRDKIMNDISQKAELERSKMLAEQWAKEQANVSNQQNLLSTIWSALLQMKLAQEAAAKSSWWGWGGWWSYPKGMTAADLAKLWIGTWAWAVIDETQAKAAAKKTGTDWKDWLGPVLTLGARFWYMIPVVGPVVWTAMLAWWLWIEWANIIQDLKNENLAAWWANTAWAVITNLMAKGGRKKAFAILAKLKK